MKVYRLNVCINTQFQHNFCIISIIISVGCFENLYNATDAMQCGLLFALRSDGFVNCWLILIQTLSVVSHMGLPPFVFACDVVCYCFCRDPYLALIVTWALVSIGWSLDFVLAGLGQETDGDSNLFDIFVSEKPSVDSSDFSFDIRLATENNILFNFVKSVKLFYG